VRQVAFRLPSNSNQRSNVQKICRIKYVIIKTHVYRTPDPACVRASYFTCLHSLFFYRMYLVCLFFQNGRFQITTQTNYSSSLSFMMVNRMMLFKLSILLFISTAESLRIIPRRTEVRFIVFGPGACFSTYQANMQLEHSRRFTMIYTLVISSLFLSYDV